MAAVTSPRAGAALRFEIVTTTPVHPHGRLVALRLSIGTIDTDMSVTTASLFCAGVVIGGGDVAGAVCPRASPPALASAANSRVAPTQRRHGRR